jgi:hypothetical protein
MDHYSCYLKWPHTVQCEGQIALDTREKSSTRQGGPISNAVVKAREEGNCPAWLLRADFQQGRVCKALNKGGWWADHGWRKRGFWICERLPGWKRCALLQSRGPKPPCSFQSISTLRGTCPPAAVLHCGTTSSVDGAGYPAMMCPPPIVSSIDLSRLRIFQAMTEGETPTLRLLRKPTSIRSNWGSRILGVAEPLSYAQCVMYDAKWILINHK